MRIADERGPIEVVASAWIDPATLVLLVEIGAPFEPAPAADWLVRAVGPDAEHEVHLRTLRARATSDRATGSFIWTLGFPFDAAPSTPPLLMSRRDEIAKLDTEYLVTTLRSPIEFGEACNDLLGNVHRSSALGFLADTPRAHGRGYSAQTCQALKSIRDIIRPPLPGSDVDPAVPLAARLDQIIQLDTTAFWLRGWVRDGQAESALLTVIAPEGGTGTVGTGAITFDVRPDLVDIYGSDPEIPTLGFWAFVELDAPTFLPVGWILEVRTASGAAIQDAPVAPVVTDTAQLELQLRQMPISELTEAVLEHQFLATAERLVASPGSGSVEKITDHGTLPSEPDISVVVAVSQVDRIEHQVLAFSRDPGFDGVELIYVVAGEHDESRLDRLGDGLSSLHRVPLRMVRVSARCTRARSYNLGVSLARGRLLVLMGADVIPDAFHWVGTMASFRDGHPSVSGVAPRLLHEDGSVASGPVRYHRSSGPSGWQVSAPWRGLSPTLDPDQAATLAPAIADEFLMLSTDQFRVLGGMCELYFGRDSHRHDLSLSLRSAGLETWYLPGVEHYLLERDSWSSCPTPAEAAFDAWLFKRRWQALLDPEQIWIDAGSRSEPTPTFEILEIERAQLNGGPVLEAGLVEQSHYGDRSVYRHTYAFAIEGWAVPRTDTPLRISLRADQSTSTGWHGQETIANLRLPDEAVDKSTARDRAKAAGYRFVVGSLRLPPEFDLVIDAEDGSSPPVQLARLRCRRGCLRSEYTPTVQPLLVTTIGRSGSVWLTTLLSRHPAIIACHPFEHEVVLASYWASVLQQLADPSSYMQAIVPERTGDLWWTGQGRITPLPAQFYHATMPRWMGCESVEALARFCQSQVERFHIELAKEERKPHARFCVEKSFPGGTPHFLSELYPGSREIIMVRDPRDRVCSILDYNAKRGFELFGRAKAQSDAEWFDLLQTDLHGLMEAWRQRRDRAHLIRYEDLVADPYATLSTAFRYVGVECEGQHVTRALDDAATVVPNAQLAHQTSPSVQSSIGRWKADLSDSHKAACEKYFAEFMAEFGYV